MGLRTLAAEPAAVGRRRSGVRPARSPSWLIIVCRGRRRPAPAGAAASGVLLFVLDGWDVAELGVEALLVVPADPLDDRELELLAAAPDAVADQLGLEGVDERFRHGIVEGVADRAGRGEQGVLVERLAVVAAGVLPEFKQSSQRCRFTKWIVVARPALLDALIAGCSAPVIAEAA